MTDADTKRPIIFGEVLFDRFPDGNMVLGGAPFNVAWHLQAFGQAPVFISRVGDDPLGRQIRDTMRNWGMDTGGLQMDAVHPTGTVEVSFENQEPRYDIVDNRAYDFVSGEAFPALANVSLVYHGSLALRSEVAYRAFQKLTTAVSAPRFLDVNLRAPWWQPRGILDLIAHAAWVKLNAQELALLAPGGDASSEAAAALRHRHGLRAVILTRGAEGAHALTPDASINVASAPAETVVDTVGAGDAFASVALLGLLREWPLETTLQRAQAFASAIVGVRGATVHDHDFYTRFATTWGLPRPSSQTAPPL